MSPLIWAATVDKNKYGKADIYQKIAGEINKAFKEDTVATSLNNKDFSQLIKEAEKDHIMEGSSRSTNNATGAKRIRIRKPKDNNILQHSTKFYNKATGQIVEKPKKDIPDYKICKRPGITCQQERFHGGKVKNGKRIWAGCRACTCKTKHWKTDCATFQHHTLKAGEKRTKTTDHIDKNYDKANDYTNKMNYADLENKPDKEHPISNDKEEKKRRMKLKTKVTMKTKKKLKS